MMIRKTANISLLVIGALPLFLLNLQSTQAIAKVFDAIPPIRLSQENRTANLIDPAYLRDYDPPRLLKNSDIEEKNITIHRNETTTISYRSPCGIPDTIYGKFLDGGIHVADVGKNQKLILYGNQTEFFENDDLARNGTELVNIPTHLQDGNYKLVVVIDCDDTINYYISNAVLS